MKNAKKPDRITSELLEIAYALNKHNVLPAKELNQIQAFCIKPPVYTAKKAILICTSKSKMN